MPEFTTLIRKCNGCKIDKLLFEYSKHKNRKYGYDVRCKVCKSNDDKKYYKKNSEKLKNKVKKWYKENKERALLSRKQWVKKNKEESYAYKKEWAETNNKKVQESRNKWKQENPEKVKKDRKVCVSVRRARIKNAIPEDANMIEIREFYKNCPDGYQIDHIIPLSKGGKHEINNLQYLTIKENQLKGNLMPDEWEEKKNKLKKESV